MRFNLAAALALAVLFVTSVPAKADDMTVFTGRAFDITCNSATISGQVSNLGGSGTMGLLLNYINDSDVTSWTKYQASEVNWENEFFVSVKNLVPNSTYYYKAYILTNGVYRCSEVRTFHTSDIDYSAGKAVDMGLSVKWASMNLGAKSEDEIGMFFAWGETSPKPGYTRDNYDFSVDAGKDCYDAAKAKLSGDWRVPTKTEWEELVKHCYWNWTTRNGIDGFLVTSKFTGNSIFLPFPKKCTISHTSSGYWSASKGNKGDNLAITLYSNSKKPDIQERLSFIGQMIRPVKVETLTFKLDKVADAGHNYGTISGSMPAWTNGHRVQIACSDKDSTEINLLRSGTLKSTDIYNGKFSLKYENLKPGTKYHCMAIFMDGRMGSLSNIESFTTKVPNVSIQSSVSLSGRGNAKLCFSISSDVRITRDDIICYFEKGTLSLDSLIKPISARRIDYNDSFGRYYISLSSLEIGEKYSFVCRVKAGDSYYCYGKAVTFKVPTDEPEPEAVDLGLSVKWASFNLGSSLATNPGKEYYWGQTDAKRSSTHYHYYQMRYSEVASYALGWRWRTPTSAEMQELVDNCVWTWTRKDGVSGYEATSKINGNSVFFPVPSGKTFYWSSTPLESINQNPGGWYSAKGYSYGLRVSKSKHTMDKRKLKKACFIRPVSDNK